LVTVAGVFITKVPVVEPFNVKLPTFVILKPPKDWSPVKAIVPSFRMKAPPAVLTAESTYCLVEAPRLALGSADKTNKPVMVSPARFTCPTHERFPAPSFSSAVLAAPCAAGKVNEYEVTVAGGSKDKVPEVEPFKISPLVLILLAASRFTIVEGVFALVAAPLAVTAEAMLAALAPPTEPTVVTPALSIVTSPDIETGAPTPEALPTTIFEDAKVTSPGTSERKDGVAAPPELGPAKTKLAF
jgi:hypothetical protein